MMNESALVRVVANEPPAESCLGWATASAFQVPETTLRDLGLTGFVRPDGGLQVPADFCVGPTREHARALRMRRAYTDRPPASSRLPFSYRHVPGWLRTRLATALGRWKRRSVDTWAAFPGWPLDLSADFVADLDGTCPSPFASGPTPVLLTHDLDSAEGLENLATRFLDMEENAGARSTNYVVPCAWPLDHGLLAEVHRRGHSIGIHGYDHSNRTPFAPPQELERRLSAARPLMERYRIEGYRAPSLVRTRRLMESLAGHYVHDSSIPTSGGLFPTPNNGCASARPFRIGKLIEIPLSMPRDGSLRFLGHGPDEILELWVRCAERISRSGGVVVLLTHCENRFSGNPEMLRAYHGFLDHISSSERFAWSVPSEVARAFVESERGSNP